ncbi:GNAT family N-acetyltransferase [Microbacterium keratanolyticum]
MEITVLTTDRLTLRPPTAADVDAITTACQDPEIPRWTTVPSPYSRTDAEAFVRIVDASWADGSEAIWSIFHDGVLVGTVGLHNIASHPAGGQAELGYWMTAESRGQGFLVEAARAVLDWAFAELDLARVHWQAVEGNIPSARAARALGFHFEGTRRQALTSHRGRDDGWTASLLPTDDRTPVAWPVLEG